MGAQIYRMTPLLPEQAEELQDFVLEVIQQSAALGNRQHHVNLVTLRELLRIINGCYSHMIEGYHDPPSQEVLQALLKRFAECYAPEQHHGVLKLVAAAAAHHRLMWIHPFLDGNGRVARHFTQASLHRIPLQGLGLWSVSRGLARRYVEYKAALSRADAPRRNDLDGRGNLSKRKKP